MAYGQFAYHYDRLMEDMPYPEWIEFAKQCWSKYGQPASVVDLGCGTGTIAVELARMGLHVTGIDLSEQMLAIASEKTERLRKDRELPAGSSIAWIHQDIREWELPELADSVISFCDCFSYLLEEEHIRDAFGQTYAGLKPGGVFMFDVHTERQLRDYADSQPFVLDEDDIAYIWTCELDEKRCEIEHSLTIFASEEAFSSGSGEQSRGMFRRVEEMHVQRAYPLDWLKKELQRAGFTDIQLAADFAWTPPTESTGRAFFIARKPL